MTEEQLATLAAHIRANTNAEVVAALAIRNDTELARIYNLSSSFIVWRTEISVEEYRAAITWTEVDALTVGKARIWEWVTSNMTLPLNTSIAAVRQGIADCWGSSTTTRASLLSVAKRAATVAEQIFATGTGTTSTPGALVFEGVVTIEDISTALNG